MERTVKACSASVPSLAFSKVASSSPSSFFFSYSFIVGFRGGAEKGRWSSSVKKRPKLGSVQQPEGEANEIDR